MLNKSEKSHFFIKILLLLVIVFFVAMAFVQPKPVIEQVEKPYVIISHAQ
ncbi:MAG: hypothetical protein IJY58_00360 [Alphaproteobacteria bacterium]|nr:hypothetical protein [Alphaproteobacteria bacterium]